MPFLIAEAMLAKGIKPLVMALEESTFHSFLKMGLTAYKLHPIEVSKARRLMQKHGVQEVSFAGRIPHQVLLQIRPWHLSLDLFFLWYHLPDTRADTVLGALCNYFQQHGICVIDSARYLLRFLFKSSSTTSLSSDALLGMAVAKTLGCMDVGQTVVVNKGTVVALEGMEGTNKCIDRAIELGSEGATLVKMAKPNQDMRFDVPVVGETTFERLLRGKFKALVVEKDKTLCLDLEALEEAKAKGLEIHVITEAEVKLALDKYRPRDLLGEQKIKSEAEGRVL